MKPGKNTKQPYEKSRLPLLTIEHEGLEMQLSRPGGHRAPSRSEKRGRLANPRETELRSCAGCATLPSERKMRSMLLAAAHCRFGSSDFRQIPKPTFMFIDNSAIGIQLALRMLDCCL